MFSGDDAPVYWCMLAIVGALIIGFAGGYMVSDLWGH